MSAATLPYTRRIRATFQPRRTDDLRTGEGVMPVGYRGEFRGLWIVDDEDGGNYVGQTVWQATENEFTYWVPDEDLTDVEVVHEGIPARTW